MSRKERLTNYTQQTATEPVFEELLWSKPETKRTAGKLLIVGGNAHGISAPLQAYETAQDAGIGHTRVLLPDALKPVVGQMLEQGDYAPSTPSGSLSKQALAELLDVSTWADVTLLAGDLGRNSETAILLESFLSKTTDRLIATADAADYIISSPDMVATTRNNLLLVISLSQLQKYIKRRGHKQTATLDSSLPQLTTLLKEINEETGLSIITRHHDNILFVHNQRVSVTNAKDAPAIWRLRVAVFASVWLAQQPEKPFESITTAVWHSLQAKGTI